MVVEMATYANKCLQQHSEGAVLSVLSYRSMHDYTLGTSESQDPIECYGELLGTGHPAGDGEVRAAR